MNLYVSIKCDCCHPTYQYVLAETPECAAEMVTTEDLKWYDSPDQKIIRLLDVDVSSETTPRILDDKFLGVFA